MRNDEGASGLAGTLAGLAGCAGWAGRQKKASAGLRLLAAALLFLFAQTGIETEKHRVKGEEYEYKENILKLLELSTI